MPRALRGGHAGDRRFQVPTALLICAAFALASFSLFLIFCAFVVVYTGDTKGLRDVAVAVRAFRTLISPWRH
jgi:hypothetical protein